MSWRAVGLLVVVAILSRDVAGQCTIVAMTLLTSFEW